MSAIFGDPRLPERFWGKVEPEPNTGCWLWTGAFASRAIDGYGNFHVGGYDKRAHRVAYEALVGPIPAGMVIDHKCRVTWCVNPAHLRVCTQGENTLAPYSLAITAKQARRDTCIKGHPFDYVRRNGDRRCRVCERARRARKPFEVNP